MPDWGQEVIGLWLEREKIIRTTVGIDESDYDTFAFKKSGLLKSFENEVGAIIVNELVECEREGQNMWNRMQQECAALFPLAVIGASKIGTPIKWEG